MSRHRRLRIRGDELLLHRQKQRSPRLHQASRTLWRPLACAAFPVDATSWRALSAAGSDDNLLLPRGNVPPWGLGGSGFCAWRGRFDPPRYAPSSNPQAFNAPVGSPDDIPKQVGFGSLIHRRKRESPRGRLRFVGLAPKAESVGWFLESVSVREIASRINAEQILNEAAVSRAARAVCSKSYLELRTVGLRSNWAKPL
jgi:hypothetical protein